MGEPPSDVLSVLLISPVEGVDPPSGDVTYTEALLSNPPDGVRYTTYVDAIKQGTLVDRGRRASLPRSGSRTWHKSSWSDVALLGARQVERGLRRWGIAFREPFRFFTPRPGVFDLVHAHVFSLRLWSERVPLVQSSAGPLRLPYQDAWGWSPRRILIAESIDRALAWSFGVNQFSSHGPQVSGTIVFSEFDRRRRIAQGQDPNSVHVIPNFADPAPVRRDATNVPFHVGFIGTDFVAKGGPEVLRTWRRVRAQKPHAQLTIVGSPPALPQERLDAEGIQWLDRVDRRVLRSEVIPSFDVFLYPTRFDGLPYVVLEALAAGVPVVTSAYGALPEVVDRAGVVVRSGASSDYATAVLELLDPGRNATASREAVLRYTSTYAPEAVLPKLGDLYRAATDARRPTKPDGGSAQLEQGQ